MRGGVGNIPTYSETDFDRSALLPLDEVTEGRPRYIHLAREVGFELVGIGFVHAGQFGVLVYPHARKLFLNFAVALTRYRRVGKILVPGQRAKRRARFTALQSISSSVERRKVKRLAPLGIGVMINFEPGGFGSSPSTLGGGTSDAGCKATSPGITTTETPRLPTASWIATSSARSSSWFP